MKGNYFEKRFKGVGLQLTSKAAKFKLLNLVKL